MKKTSILCFGLLISLGASAADMKCDQAFIKDSSVGSSKPKSTTSDFLYSEGVKPISSFSEALERLRTLSALKGERPFNFEEAMEFTGLAQYYVRYVIKNGFNKELQDFFDLKQSIVADSIYVDGDEVGMNLLLIENAIQYRNVDALNLILLEAQKRKLTPHLLFERTSPAVAQAISTDPQIRAILDSQSIGYDLRAMTLFRSSADLFKSAERINETKSISEFDKLIDQLLIQKEGTIDHYPELRNNSKMGPGYFSILKNGEDRTFLLTPVDVPIGFLEILNGRMDRSKGFTISPTDKLLKVETGPQKNWIRFEFYSKKGTNDGVIPTPNRMLEIGFDDQGFVNTIQIGQRTVSFLGWQKVTLKLDNLKVSLPSDPNYVNIGHDIDNRDDFSWIDLRTSLNPN